MPEASEVSARFAHYAPYIKALPERLRFSQDDLLVPEFEIQRTKQLVVYYAPFDCINATAKIVLLGITPSWNEMEQAFRVAQRGLRQGLDAEAICHQAKQQASFAGSMRRNLCQMLDQLGLPHFLHISNRLHFLTVPMRVSRSARPFAIPPLFKGATLVVTHLGSLRRK